ncbi:hypothetical protein KTS45_05555 [Halomicroarcula limicola]|uniref:DUF7310 domain-containing protein n=1 Tax=Haloarcula limicola TaxID=1429915 RepID=A0A8J7Y445_9EURY|nr:hypothetical protein [Halomicroarcula limicola]MBV0923662.1 hypothetical protein [Halomicroarcula limicola]
MTDAETLEERVRTVERAVTDGDHEFPEATELADLRARVEALEQRFAELDDRTSELEAATQALRGYVGNVRSVNQDVERRADAALAAVEEMERRLDDRQPSATDSDTGTAEQGSVATAVEKSARAETVAPADATPPTETPRAAYSADGASSVEADAQRRRSSGTDAADLAASTCTDDHADSERDPGVVERIRSVL